MSLITTNTIIFPCNPHPPVLPYTQSTREEDVMFGNRLDELDNFNNTRILLTGDVIEVRSVDERFVTIHVTRTRTGGSKTFELNHPVETWEKERVESVLSAEFLQGEELYLRTDGRIAPLPPAQYGKELAERRYGS